MSFRSRISPAIASFLTLPSAQTSTLLTSTLECSVDWLTARLILSTLQANDHEDGTGVILVSWMQNEAYWRSQLKLSLGADLTKLTLDAPFVFVDCLNTSFSGSSIRSDARIDTLLARIEQELRSVTAKDDRRKAIIVFDRPDILLSIDPAIDSHRLSAFILKLRSHNQVHAVAMSCTADLPCLSQRDVHITTLDKSLAVFLVQQAHMANRIFSCRPLKTGSARDVSGILRITAGGDGSKQSAEAKDLEKRYLVQRDGAVKVVE